MAVAALETKLEELLLCSVCLDTYTDPKILPCYHVFCLECLRSLVLRSRVTCPSCRLVVAVPPNGVAGFQSAYRVNEIKAVKGDLKSLIKEASIKGGSNANYHCSEHEGRELEVYCKTCEKLVCLRCAYTGNHNNHNCQDVDAAFQDYDQILKPAMRQELESLYRKIEKSLEDLNEGVVESDNIHVSIRNHNIVLLSVRDEVQAAWDKVTALLHMLREEQIDKMGALQAKTIMMDQVMQITNKIQSSLSRLRDPDPSLSYIAGVVGLAVPGEKTVLTLHVMDYMNKMYCGKPCKLEGVLVFDSNRRNCHIKQRECQGQYEISYKPDIQMSQVTLVIMINDQHIKDGPFTVTLRPPAEKPFIFCIERPRTPYGVAGTGAFKVVASEDGAGCVSTFTSFGTKSKSFGSFDSPRGVAVDGVGNVLVADCGEHCIVKFSPRGKLIMSVGCLGSEPLQFYCPSGIAFNRTNNKVYVVDKNHRVQVLNSGLAFSKTICNVYRLRVVHSDLTFSCTFGEFGSDHGQFNDPQGIACDGHGRVYVADSGNHRVQVFTAEGTCLNVFGILGDGKADYPIGIAVDSRNMMYITECGRVSVFSAEGKCVHSLCKMDGGAFSNSQGLTACRPGILYVCDGNRGIQVIVTNGLNLVILVGIVVFIISLLCFVH